MKDLLLALVLFVIVAFGGFLYRNALEMSARNEQHPAIPMVTMQESTSPELALEQASTTASTSSATSTAASSSPAR